VIKLEKETGRYRSRKKIIKREHRKIYTWRAKEREREKVKR
jgi:hypothetical protein